jgi:hypothetical protein
LDSGLPTLAGAPLPPALMNQGLLMAVALASLLDKGSVREFEVVARLGAARVLCPELGAHCR